MWMGVEAVYAVRLVLAFGMHAVVLLALLLLAVRLLRRDHPAARPMFLASGLQGLDVAQLMLFPLTQTLLFQFLTIDQAALAAAALGMVGLAVSAAKWGALLFAVWRLVEAPSAQE